MRVLTGRIVDDDKEPNLISALAPQNPRDSDATPELAPEPGERRRFALEDTGYEGVPVKHRRFFRAWMGDEKDRLGDNEQRCPRCGVVLRSYRELREGDHLHCIPCDLRLKVERHGSSLRAVISS